jgi:hypothetical protein
MSELLKINVNDHTEKKNGLTYLSWAWAWAEVLKIDPGANWYPMYFQADGEPKSILCQMGDGTAMVGVSVAIKGLVRQCLLPVMDHKNKAIQKPNAFDVNKAVMRCLAKAISMHGLGLYIYAGEDLPEQEQDESMLAQTLKASIEAEKTKKQLQAVGIIKPTEGAGKGLSDERRAAIEEIALHLVDCHKAERDVDAVRIWYAPDTFLDNDERVYCWHLLAAESKLRSTIKASKPEAAKA